MTTPYEVTHETGAVPIKRWTRGVPVDEGALRQLTNTARLPFIHKWVAAMPDVHFGMGATIGSVVPTVGAVIPAAVGVDIGCGMAAVQTSLTAADLPTSLAALRAKIEAAVPVGMEKWSHVPGPNQAVWDAQLGARFQALCEKHPRLHKTNNVVHLGTLGTGNHFIEVCLDEEDRVWLMLHSGSRGVGNAIGTHFIAMAKEDMRVHHVNLPDQDLAYLSEGTTGFDDYVEAVSWAQDFAKHNRALMMQAVVGALQATPGVPPFTADLVAVDCHHNYVAREHHYGKNVLVTRKGAVRARAGDMGIIPGSMGARSFIVRGLGNPESFCSCSHGAGRVMSRTQAKKLLTVADHAKATEGVECRKDEGILDESPAAYKPIEAVMKAQADLVEIVHTLRQVVCVKG